MGNRLGRGAGGGGSGNTTPRGGAAAPAATDSTGRAIAELLRVGRAAYRELGALGGESTVFFVDSPGTGVVELAAAFARYGGYTLMAPAAEDVPAANGLAEVEAATVASRWTEPPSAVLWLTARQGGHMLHYMPAAAASATSVRVHTRSPVEDRFVAVPLLLDGCVNATTLATLELMTEVTWRELTSTVAPSAALWVYVRLADPVWAAVCDSHRAKSGTSDARIEQWNRWREKADDVFLRARFTLDHHTLVITVHNEVLTTDAVVADIGAIVSRHILAAHQAGSWTATTPPLSAAELRAFVSDPDYQRARHATASQAQVLRTVAGVDSPPPLSVRAAPHDTPLDFGRVPARRRALSSARADSAPPALTLGGSPFDTLPRVHSQRRN
jgi:hypothetical protein